MRSDVRYRLKSINIDENGNKTSCVVTTGDYEYTYNIMDVIQAIKNGTTVKNAVITESNELKLISNDKKFKDLSNLTFNEWTVKEYLGNKYWLCECSCKRKKAVYTQSLLKGQSKSCGHQAYNFIDLTDKYFGDWHVISWDRDAMAWNCECACTPGIIHKVRSGALLGGYTKSCGHDTNVFIDLTGQHVIHKDDAFGKLTVIGYAGNNQYNCLCECGNETKVYKTNLLTQQTRSCGHCYKKVRPVNLTKIIRNKELFKNALETVSTSIGDKLTMKEVSEMFEISTSHVVWLLDKYDMRDSIKYLNGQSYAEIELIDFCKELGFNVIQRERTLLNGKELDIYIPDRKFAIEYNGSYHHSNQFRTVTYHQEKTLSCQERGINLIHIFDYEWIDSIKQDKLKNLIKQILGIEQLVIYARQTELREIQYEEAKNFIDTYHLQNFVPHKTALGLYYNNELVQVMTFGKPRFNSNYDTELLRLCSKSDYLVVGGASKLFKHYIEQHNTESIISYCDLSKFNGKVYEQLGMAKEAIISPNYVYVHRVKLDTLSYMQCQKHKLIEKGWGTEDQTEEEIMNAHDYLKVYDSGNARYVYKPNNS